MKEYKVSRLAYEDEDWQEMASIMQEEMNKMAKEGWRVVDVAMPMACYALITFERDM